MPKNKNETVVVFAYWLMEREKKKEFRTRDITDCFDEARLPKPANVTQHVINVSSGKIPYLTKGSAKGLWKLTLTGEKFVEEELPRKSEA